MNILLINGYYYYARLFSVNFKEEIQVFFILRIPSLYFLSSRINNIIIYSILGMKK